MPKACDIKNKVGSVLAGLAILLVASPAVGQSPGPSPGSLETGDNPKAQKLDEVTFEQKLGAQIPFGLTFANEQGERVALGKYFGNGRPVIVMMGYFECPMLCNLVRKGLIDTLAEIGLEMGRDYTIVSVSVDPNEGAKLAESKTQKMVERYRKKGGEQVPKKIATSGMHNLTGDKQAIERLAETIGFRYRYDPEKQQYMHPSGFVVASPDGSVSKYFFGVEYRARDLRLGLVDASQGQVGSAIDQVLLRCYQYDPKTGSYSFAIMRVLRIVGFLTTLLLAFSIWTAFRDSGRLEGGPGADRGRDATLEQRPDQTRVDEEDA